MKEIQIKRGYASDGVTRIGRG